MKIQESKIKEVRRPEFKGLNWATLDDYRKKLNESWAKNIEAERDGRIRDFWLRARNCNRELNQTPQPGHSSLETLDLIAACSGYKSCADFVHLEFGENYDKERDELLQALIESSNKSGTAHPHRKNKGESSQTKVFKRLRTASQTTAKRIRENKRNFTYLLVALVMIIGLYILSGNANEAQIHVMVATRYVNFETAHATSIRSKEHLVLACNDHFSIRNGIYSLDYPYSYNSPVSARFKSIKQNHIGIEHLKIPAQSQITIETPTQTDLYFNFSASAGLNGFIPLNQAILFSPDDKDSVFFENSPGGTGVNFESYIDQNFDISMVNSIDFEWPPIYINSVSFGQLMQEQVVYGIGSAQIVFLSDNKIKQLSPGDLLSITPENPIKLLLSYREGLLHAEFTGSVNSLYGGPEIFGKSSANNIMPKKWETNWVYFPPIFLVFSLVFYLSFPSEKKKKP